MPTREGLSPMLAPSLGLPRWWENKEQVTAEREIHCHQEIQSFKKEITRFPSEQNQAWQGFCVMWRLERGSLDTMIYSLSSALVANVCEWQWSLHSPPWVMSSVTESFGLFISTLLPSSACKQMLPSRPNLMIPVNISQSLCWLETWQLGPTGAEWLNWAGCRHSSFLSSAHRLDEERVFTSLPACHLTFNLVFLRCSYSGLPVLATC
jgi:hypothetical protein